MSSTPPRPPSTGEVLIAPDDAPDDLPPDADGDAPSADRRPSPVPRKASSVAPEPDERPPAELPEQDTPAPADEEAPEAVEQDAKPTAEPPGPADEPPEPSAPAPPPTAAVPAPPPTTDAVPAVDQAPPTEVVPAADPDPATGSGPPVDRAARTEDIDPPDLAPDERVERTGPTEQSLTSLSLTERLPLPSLPATLDVSTTRPVSTKPAPRTPAGPGTETDPATTANPTTANPVTANPATTDFATTAPADGPPRTPTRRTVSTEPVSSVTIPGRATRPVRASSGPPSAPFPAQPGPQSAPFPAQHSAPRTGPGRAVGPTRTTPPHTPVGPPGRPMRPGPPRRDPVTDPDRVRDDRVGLATARAAGSGGLVLALVLGLLVGGLAGAAAGYLLGPRAAASSLVRPTPPVSIDTAIDTAADTATANGPAPAELSAFLGAETVRLSDGAFAAAVAERLGRSDPPGIDVVREPGTALLRITGTDRSATAALAATTAAVQVYTERRDAENRAALDAALAGVDGAIAALGQPAPGDVGALGRIERLRDLRADAVVLAGAAGPSVAVLEPPAALAPGPPRWALGAAIGALAGAVLALALVGLRRGRSPALDPGAVEAHVGTLLQPAVRLPARWPERLTGGPGSPERRTARLLLAQLLGEREPAGRVIVVLGGSAGSRADAVATLLAVAAAERAATVLVRLGARHRPRDPLQRVLPMDPDGRGRPLVDGLIVLDADSDDVPGGLDALIAAQARRASMVVLDAGTAGGDADLPTALRAADLAVLVARAGVDRLDDVAVVGAALRAGRAGVSGVVVRSA